MAWKLEFGKPLAVEVVSVESNDETGERREIYRYTVPGGFLYQFVNERKGDRFESISFVPALPAAGKK